jgi:UDP-N-acetylenolpyruvoylglucosamine reductase
MTLPHIILDGSMQSESNTTADALAKRVSSETLVRRNELLAKRTTLRVGGPADLYVEPASEEDLAAVLKFCAVQGIAFFVLGRGSNLLVRDAGFRGVVICLAHPQFSRIEIMGECLRCGAGARLKSVAVEAKRHGLAGLEFLEGIPGGIGGALRMNAGAMGSSLFEVVESVRLMDFNGVPHERPPEEMAVDYRSCPSLKAHIALGAVLKGRPDTREAIAQRMTAFSQKRWSSQPAAPSAGCIFKNTPMIPAGRLIEELGLKGLRVGGAVVSAEHGNFIVNDGAATARDVLELIERIKHRAKAARGIELHTEVEIVGED